MDELRRQVILKELEKQGFMLAMDGRLLTELSSQELETERVRLPELLEVSNG